MSRPEEPASVGPWAREKLDALGAYLSFYTTALKKQGQWRKTFIDAFAGGGRARIRQQEKNAATESLLAELEPAPVDTEVEQYIRGSPRVALDIETPFDRYVFIERDPARVAELEAMRDEYGPRYQMEIRRGHAEDELASLIDGDLARRGQRAVVFLDPFGMAIPWETVQRLAATRQVEVVVNFALGMAIQRLLVRSAEIPPSWRQALDRFFGSPDWHSQVYEEGSDLFGPRTLKVEGSGQRLLEWYCGRLKAAFGHVSTPRLIKNSRGAPLYYLIWAGPHSLGLKGADYILSKGVKLGR